MSYDSDEGFEDIFDMKLCPSDRLVQRTKTLAGAAGAHRRAANSSLPFAVSVCMTLALLAFALLMLLDVSWMGIRPSVDTAAIYTVDINPSVEFRVDIKMEVIQVRSLNEDGKNLLKQINCIGMEIRECISRLISTASEMGYADETEANYIIISEIVLDTRFASIEKYIEEMTVQGPINVIFFAGSEKDKEIADQKGISTGKEIYRKKARELGIEISDEALMQKSIDDLISIPAGKTDKVLVNSCEYAAPAFTVKPFEGYLEISWDRIDDEALKGYKIVISKNDPEPAYPDDGYLTYITDTDQSSYIIDNKVKYTDGDFGGCLENNNKYYVNMTAVYEGQHVSGTAVYVRFTAAPSPARDPSSISGERLSDGTLRLNWEKIENESFMGYKVVASATNPSPTYPADGYIKYITDRDVTSLLIDSAFSSVLVPGTEYYFSITVLYNDKKSPGNSVKLKYMDKEQLPSVSYISGKRLSDGSIKLVWDQINDKDFRGYKVVASSTNASPKYPDDGYIAYITDNTKVSLLVDGSFSDRLEYGKEYYFSITALYENRRTAGNSVKLRYMDALPSPLNGGCDISGRREPDGTILLSWETIGSSDFKGYKVVASATNPSPAYPADGYIKYITDRNMTSLLVDSTFSSFLTPGTEYYFSITVLYNDKKVPGNAIKLKYLDENTVMTRPASNISGQRLDDGSILLSWEEMTEEGFEGYKIVASADNENPEYPEDGYIRWITDRSITTLLVDDSFVSVLSAGRSYHFSVTVLYNGHNTKVPGNSVCIIYK